MPFDKALLDTMGVTTERLFGYVYAGVLSFGSAWLVQPKPIEDLMQAVGPIVSLVLLITVGSAVFAFYMRVIGGVLLFPITHKLHELIDRARGRVGVRSVTSSITFLRLIGVSDPEAAYVEVKDCFDPAGHTSPTETRFHFAHGEVNFFYLLAIVTSMTGLVALLQDLGPTLPWFIVAALSYLLAIIADIRVHAFATVQMRNGSAELKEFLKARNFLT
jgi:hypothetical protein